GKGTLAQLLAQEYDLAYLDTGSLYRGVAYMLLRAGKDPADEAAAEDAAAHFSLDEIEGADIRTREVGAAASKVAAMPGVRKALLDFQRRFAKNPPAGKRGAVLDGRDIGTVVCPDADLKFFVIASPEVRAHRRFLELKAQKPGPTEREVFDDLAERDARDAARTDAPMVQAPDAELLDTTRLTIEAAFAAARRVVDGVFRRCED
ncbi:MAG TPA: (d)CMP kinase, partial [Parvularculaceae bacterium]|nr:(d)CMP kinase [Parvularculaceae bacterium]